jgi:hypothetical protein
MYNSISNVVTYNIVKKEHFLWTVQRRRKKCHEKAYFSNEFCHFYIGTHKKSIFFSKSLRGHVGHRDVHTTLVYFLNISKYVGNAFQVKGAYAPRSQNTMSHLFEILVWVLANLL